MYLHIIMSKTFFFITEQRFLLWFRMHVRIQYGPFDSISLVFFNLRCISRRLSRDVAHTLQATVLVPPQHYNHNNNNKNNKNCLFGDSSTPLERSYRFHTDPCHPLAANEENASPRSLQAALHCRVLPCQVSGATQYRNCSSASGLTMRWPFPRLTADVTFCGAPLLQFAMAHTMENVH